MHLSIPPTRDPAARAMLLIMAGIVIALAFAPQTAPERANAAPGVIILESDAAPTPALPTPLAGDDLARALPTATPEAWIDQALGAVGAQADQFAAEQAGQLAEEQQAAQAAAEQAARDQYLANVGAQAAHSPRGDVPQPPAYESGPILIPASADMPSIIIDPAPAPAPEGIAVAVPPQQYMEERTSNSCPAGQVFYPRTGCHTPGSGGAMPGAVGTP